VALAATPLRVLAALLAAAGRTLSREELTAACWRDRHVADGSLTQAVWTLRRALGAVIVTVPGQGYRFVAPAARDDLDPLRADAALLAEGRDAESLLAAEGAHRALLRGGDDAARVGLAEVLCMLPAFGAGVPSRVWPEAEALVAGARDARALVIRGFVAYWYRGDRARARACFEDAIAGAPALARPRHWYGELLTAEGRFAEALAHLEAARSLDARSHAVRADLAQALLFAGEPRRALAALGPTVLLASGFARARVVEGLAHAALGDALRARDALDAAARRTPADVMVVAARAATLARLGRPRLAREARRRVRHPYAAAVVDAALGERARVRAALAAAEALRDGWVRWARVDPRLR
jgi:tetratricopeptide (TPR) repeat protein